jgi:hypothetical protein
METGNQSSTRREQRPPEAAELLEAGRQWLRCLRRWRIMKRQKKRLSARPTIDSPKARAEMRAFMKDDDEEAAN